MGGLAWSKVRRYHLGDVLSSAYIAKFEYSKLRSIPWPGWPVTPSPRIKDVASIFLVNSKRNNTSCLKEVDARSVGSQHAKVTARDEINTNKYVCCKQLCNVLASFCRACIGAADYSI